MPYVAVPVVSTNLDTRDVARRVCVEREPILVARGRVGDDCARSRLPGVVVEAHVGEPRILGAVAGDKARVENGPDDVSHEVVAAGADGDSVVGVVQAKV